MPRGASAHLVGVVFWRSVLGIATIGVDDNFFFVGGDSVLAKLDVLHVEKALGVGPMLHLLEQPTIAAMAQVVDAISPAAGHIAAAAEIRPANAPEELPRIEPNPTRRKEIFPLIDLQRAYWVAQKAMPGPRGACHRYFERDLVDIDLLRLETAWQTMVARHEMLRAFATPEGAWQVVEDPPPYRFKVVDLSGHVPAERERVLLEARERMAERSPDFETWPMFEIRVHRLGDRRMRLHFANNLLLLDFQSWVVLEREWKQAYDDPGVCLPSLELTFRDYALGLHDAENAPVILRARKYWESRLHTLPAAPALPQRVLMDSAGLHWRHKSLRFEPAMWSALKHQAGRRGLTPSFFTGAAYAEVLSAFTQDAHFTLNVLT